MASENKRKIAREFNRAEAADYLRQLADALDREQIVLGEMQIPIEGDLQIKGRLKVKTGKGVLKLKIRYGNLSDDLEVPEDAGEKSEGGQDADPGKKAYKKLKKRMGSQFKAIKAGLEKNEMPAPELAEAFHAACREMVLFPDCGDEFYETFSARADAFLEAATGNEIGRLSEEVSGLAALKDRCHSEYK